MDQRNKEIDDFLFNNQQEAYTGPTRTRKGSSYNETPQNEINRNQRGSIQEERATKRPPKGILKHTTRRF